MIDSRIKDMPVGQARKICLKFWPISVPKEKARCDICGIKILDGRDNCIFEHLGGTDARRLNKKYKGRG